MPPTREGGCQCGHIRYRVSGDPVAIAICHCRQCKRQSGSAFGMSWIMPSDQLDLTGGSLKKFSRNSDSGRPVECFFCPQCGTRIYHVPSYATGVLNLKPGTLDDPAAVLPSTEVWTAERLPWLRLDCQLESHERQPF